MRWNRVALTSLLAISAAGNASAFVPAVTNTRAFIPRFSTMQMAKVNRLTDPQTQLLDQVDVFIFDCDGVIWRVRLFFDHENK
jgi:hypothetical protein